MAGLMESGILAIVAEAAAALVNRADRVTVSLGAVHAEPRLGVILAVGLILALVRLALQGVLSVIPARIGSDMQADVRRRIFAAFLRASWSEQSRDRDGHLQELVTNQATQAGQTAGQAAGLVVVGVTFLVLVASALVLNAIAALIVLLAAIGLIAALRPLSTLNNRHARTLSRAFLDFAAGVSEAVRLAEETEVFGAADAQRVRGDELVARVRRSWFYSAILLLLVPGVYQSMIYLLVVAALAAIFAIGTVPIASLGAVVLLLVRAGAYGQQIQSYLQNLGQTLPYLERIQEATRRYELSCPLWRNRPLGHVDSIAFEAVSFSYEPGREAVSDITFHVSAGETVGIVGPSGAGKSTIVQILLSLRSPDAGRYLVNGTSSEGFRRDDWHHRFAYLPQEPRLLHASVLANIEFFRDLDFAAVERAARLAGIHGDVMAWPRRYDTIVGPRADAISGGQQQRICLARALAGDPDVLVLDEPTSALDPHAEALIQESLASLRRELTLFVVAHRLSTLEVCERVMVIIDGRLQAFDRVEALRSTSTYYRAVSGFHPGVRMGQPAGQL